MKVNISFVVLLVLFALVLASPTKPIEHKDVAVNEDNGVTVMDDFSTKKIGPISDGSDADADDEVVPDVHQDVTTDEDGHGEGEHEESDGNNDLATSGVRSNKLCRKKVCHNVKKCSAYKCHCYYKKYACSYYYYGHKKYPKYCTKYYCKTCHRCYYDYKCYYKYSYCNHYYH